LKTFITFKRKVEVTFKLGVGPYKNTKEIKRFFSTIKKKMEK
jgi:hypothetical protein